MGQAKRRGTLEDRIAQAQAVAAAGRPTAIVCNQCKRKITEEITELDVRGMAGITAAFAALCPECKSPTYAVKGKPDAVRRVFSAMVDTGEQPILGMQTADGEGGAAGDDDISTGPPPSSGLPPAAAAIDTE